MNLIMNKIRNTLNVINVNKLMFIHMNERALHRSKEKKHKLYEIENINEEHLCQMKNELLQQETMLFANANSFEYAESFKRSASQQLTDDATKEWEGAKII